MSWHDHYEEARTALESGVAAVEKIIRDRDVESHIARLRLERLTGLLDRMQSIQEPSDAILDRYLLEEWKHERWAYGEDDVPRCGCGERLRDSDRGPVSSLEQHRVRMSLRAAFAFTPECPQPCEHLSQEDSRDGHTCAEHPCTC